MKRTRLITFFVAIVFATFAYAQVAITVLPPELEPWMEAIQKAESGRKPWAVMNNTMYRRGEMEA